MKPLSFLRRIPEGAAILEIAGSAESLKPAMVKACPKSNVLSIGPAQSWPSDPCDVLIINHALEKLPYEQHTVVLDQWVRRISRGGMIVLWEEDQADISGEKSGSYRTAAEWKAVLSRVGILDAEVTGKFLIAHVPKQGEVGYADQAADIRRGNLSVDSRTKVVFITGGTGFIGRHLSRQLLEQGLGNFQVRLIFLTRDLRRIPPELQRFSNLIPLVADFHDLARMPQVFQGVHYVFHLAGEARYFNGIDHRRHNVQSTQLLLRAVRGAPLERFIFASTNGAVERRPEDPCRELLTEAATPYPSSRYGKTKLEAEQSVLESGYPYTIVRIPWVYGEGMREDSHVRKLMGAVAGKKLVTFFNFPGRVSLIAVPDLVRVFISLASQDAARGEIFIATDGRPVSLGEIFQMMGQTLGHRTARVGFPQWFIGCARGLRRFFPAAAQNLFSDVLAASSEKLERTGFRPALSQRQAMRSLAHSLGFLKPGLEEGEKLVSVVTGAASGIGRELAKKLAAKGHGLLLIDNQEAPLKDLARELSADFLVLDLTRDDALQDLEKYIHDKNYVLDWVVNNAGVGARGDFLELELKRQGQMIQLNCIAPTLLAHLALRHFRERQNPGALINITSTSAYQPLPGMSVYAASKAFLLNFSQGISGELQGNDSVRILTAVPSGTDTAFQERAGVKKGRGDKLLAPEYVADQIIHAAEQDRRIIVIGASGHRMALAAKWIPASLQPAVWRYLMERMR